MAPGPDPHPPKVIIISALSTAITLWKQGKPIPLTVFAALVEQGYDVPALERAHRA